MEQNEGRLSMKSDSLDNIRIQLLWDKIRNLNTRMPEEMYQRMKAMPLEEWIETLQAAGLPNSAEDLTIVHDMLWPRQKGA